MSQPVERSDAQFDIVISGGGLVGACMAMALQRYTDCSVAIIETTPFNPNSEQTTYTSSYDARTSALANGSVDILKRLGVWPLIKEHACPIQQVQVSDEAQFASSSISAQDEGVDALGYVAENHWLGRCFMKHLSNSDRIKWYAPARLDDIRYIQDGVRLKVVSLEKSQSIKEESATIRLHAKLLLIAEGAQSPSRERLGIAVKRFAYDQTALVTNVTPQTPHEHKAIERFTRTGPLAMLPMEQRRYGVVWAMRSEQAEYYLKADEKIVLEAMQKNVGRRCGQLIRLGARYTYPLQLLLAEEQVRPRIALIGNAAHSLHPVAGQGFNLSLRDVMAMLDTVRLAQQNAQDIGEFKILHQYEQSRWQDQQKIVQFSDTLARVFSNKQPALVALRALGLTAFEWWPQGKRLLARHAMGRAGLSLHSFNS